MRRVSLPGISVLAVLSITACSTSKSATPLSPTVAGPIAGVDISAPQVMTPSANAEISVTQQPITLTVKNATTNGVRPVTYAFQVASDQQFSNQVFARTAITPGDGQTSVQIGDSLSPSATYYWRARAEDGANTGAWTAATVFSVYVPVVIEAPTLLQPASGATTANVRPTFVVGDASKTGPAGPIQYQLEVAQDVAFAHVVQAGLFPEQANQTSMTLSADLAQGQQFFWRVQATDGKNSGPFSATQSFKTPAPPPTPAPAPPPTPTPGASVASDMIDVSSAGIYNSPSDMARWTVSTAITSITFGGDGVSLEFSKKDGGGRWPDVVPPGWDGPLQYTIGMCFNQGGRWNCSAVIEVWHGLDPAGGPPSQIGQNWFYDDGRWGPMAHHQPAPGEQIGMFVCEGDCRNNTAGTLSPLRERSNIVVFAYPGSGTIRF